MRNSRRQFSGGMGLLSAITVLVCLVCDPALCARRDVYGTKIGAVTVKPNGEVIVGRRFYRDITYTAGEKGIKVGGVIRFALPGMFVEEGSKTSVSCSNSLVKWSCSNYAKGGSEFFIVTYLFVSIEGHPLEEGQSITVRYGSDLGMQYTAAPRRAQDWPVEVAVDTDGSRRGPGSGFYLVKNVPVVKFVNDKPSRIEVNIPSYTSTNERFRAVVRIRDRYHNLVENYKGTIVLKQSTVTKTETSKSYTFKPADKGVHEFNDLAFATEGVHRLLAADEAQGIWARSNPSKTAGRERRSQLFWGDIHCHSFFSADEAAYSPSSPRPLGIYDYARNKGDLDFCTVTDHVEDLTREEWIETCQATKKAYVPGRFVTFNGFEASFQPQRSNGDKIVYFFDDDAPWLNMRHGTTTELYDNLKKLQSRIMVIPHLHVQTNWEFHDPQLERVVEVYSHWGCGIDSSSEPPMIPGTPRRTESYVQYALQHGAKLGFIASADHSFGHPGDDFWWGLSNYHGGLAAVYATSLTREGIWDGLWSRRCYGTTRARILLEFEIDQHPMGTEFTTAQEKRNLTVHAYGTNAIATVEIIKNGTVWKSSPGSGKLDIELTLIDPQFEHKLDYYYVHVIQVDGEQAWSSPIWVTRP